MTEDEWGTPVEWITKEEELKKWPDVSMRKITEYKPSEDGAVTKDDLAGGPVFVGWDLGNGADKTILAKVTKTHATFVELYKQGSNLVDDNAYLYFQCEVCQDIFDPVTKSFKTLNDKRHEAGWKVKWNDGGQGYKVYCAKCGDGA